MAKRKSVPNSIQADVLIKCRRRCCLCYGLDGDATIKAGQIAHIDHNSANNTEDNLAFLCLSHHDAFDSRSSQAKALTIGEVKHYRSLLHALYEDKHEKTDVHLLLTLNHDFDSFTTEDLKRFLAALKTLIASKVDIRLIRMERGSVHLTISLPRAMAEQIILLYRHGNLQSFGVIDAEIIGDAAATATVERKRRSSMFDVFLCHNSGDKEAVTNIATELQSRGLLPWLDMWELRPGMPWQRALEDQIENIKSAAVFIGRSGVGPWQEMEMDAFLREFVRRRCPVIPVILPGCERLPKLPLFLSGMTWIDLRNDQPEPMDRLIWGITGNKSF